MLKQILRGILVFLTLLFMLSLSLATDFPYWIEHDENGNAMNYVWVKIDSIPASGTKTIFVKKEPGHSPDGESTFDFFDDFESGTIDSSKWTISKVGSSTLTIDSTHTLGTKSIKVYDTSDGYGRLISSTNFNTNVEANVYFYDVGTSQSTNEGFGFIFYNEPDVRLIGVKDNEVGSSNYWIKYGSNSIASTTPRSSGWHKFSIRFINGISKYFIDGNEELSLTYGSQPKKVMIGSSWVSETGTYYFDNVFVRKVTTNEPTVTVTDMGYYYKIDITNNEATDLTDYQVAIPINELGITSTTESIHFTNIQPTSSGVTLSSDKTQAYVGDLVNLNCTYTASNTAWGGYFEFYADGELIANITQPEGDFGFQVFTDFTKSTNYTIPQSKAHSTITFSCKVYTTSAGQTTYEGEDLKSLVVLNTPPTPPTNILISPDDVDETTAISVSASGADDADGDVISDYLYSVYSINADTFLVINQSVSNTFSLSYDYLDDDFIIYVIAVDSYGGKSEAANISWHDANHFTWSVSNVYNVGGNDYADTPEYNIHYRCKSASFKISLSDNTSKDVALICDDAWHDTSTNLRANSEGSITASLILIGDYNYIKTYSYISDLSDPEVDISWDLTSGFRTDYNDTYYIFAKDNVSGQIECNLTSNNGINTSVTLNNNTNQSGSFNWIDGINTFTAVCKDYVNHIKEHEESINVYVKNITLIDEETGERFNNLFSMDTLRLFSPSKEYDFLANSRTQIYYVSDQDDLIRLEKKYSGAPNDLLYIDFYPSLVPTDTRLCVSELQSFYEILLYSSLTKKVAVKNNYAQCFVLAGKTEFAYQDAFMEKIYTRKDIYYLYTYDNENKLILLGSIDGGTATSVALDMVESGQKEFSISLSTETLDVQKYLNNTLKLYFLTTKNGVIKTKIEISDVETGENYLTHIEYDSPTEFTIYFDYSSLNISSNMFKFVVTEYFADGSEHKFTRYITADGKAGMLLPSVAITLSILSLISLVTIVASAYALGWFGIFGAGFSLIVLSLAPTTAGVLLMQSVMVLVLVFIFLIWKNENIGAVR